MTDLPESGGFNTILTIVDRFTKLVKLVPCSMGGGQLGAGEVAQLFFDHVIRFFGVPSSLVHDRDPRFTGELWTALWKLMGTRTLFSTAHHPQTDGQTERTHRTLE